MTNQVRRDTGPAKLPALPKINVQDPQLARWVQSVTEYLEVRQGVRGNDMERAVTVRELQQLQVPLQALAAPKNPEEGKLVAEIAPGFTASFAVDKFAQAILDSRLFKNLAKSLDDPARFDWLPERLRAFVTKSIADEARARGAAIQEVREIVQRAGLSYAFNLREITAGVDDVSAGLRQFEAAYADDAMAMATNVLQLQASLGKYYQNGLPGRASLEQTMEVQASWAEGLRAQYTLKVQAGGALAGFGLAAEERTGDKAQSAFIIMADKFAIVGPSYTGGLLKTPRTQDVVFGVDANGIYLQNNVYIKGSMRLDGGTRTLQQGLRGSLQLGVSGYGWSDTTARQAVWQALGNGGSAPSNNHLVIGDMVTITGAGSSITRHWNGSVWTNPGAVFSGDLLVDGSVSASKINTNGLTVRDNFGNIILSSNGINASWITGLGAMARQNAAVIGSNVTFADGSMLGAWDFVNRLSKINGSNISNFMDVAAIGTAYIGNAAVGTLQIAGNAVTVPGAATGTYWATVQLYVEQACNFVLIGTFTQGAGRTTASHSWNLSADGHLLTAERPAENTVGAMTAVAYLGAGTHTFSIYTSNTTGDARCGLTVLGVKR